MLSNIDATSPVQLGQAATPLLDPPTRAVLLMALLAFVLLGMGLMLGVILGGRWVRRLGSTDLTKPLPLNRGEATGRVDREPAMLRHTHWGMGSPDETLRIDTGSSKTTAG